MHCGLFSEFMVSLGLDWMESAGGFVSNILNTGDSVIMTSHCKSSLGLCNECRLSQAAATPQTKPTDCLWTRRLLPSAPTIAIY